MGRPRTTRFFVGMVAGLPHAILSMECPDMLTPERGTLPRPPNIAPLVLMIGPRAYERNDGSDKDRTR
jgi:hypothetical protein